MCFALPISQVPFLRALFIEDGTTDPFHFQSATRIPYIIQLK